MTHAPPEPIDWYALEQTWAHARTPLPTIAHGDPWQLASEVAQRLGMCTGAATMADQPHASTATSR